MLLKELFARARNNTLLVLMLVASLLVLSSCAGVSQAASGTTQPSSSAPEPVVSVSPTGATVTAGATLQLSASVSNANSSAVSWSATAGTVSKSGLFSAPQVDSEAVVAIIATNASNASQKGVAFVTVMPQSFQKSPAIVNTENRYCAPGDVPRYPGLTDGPAQLPIHCYYTGMDGIPSPGKTWTGINPNSLYAEASCGDTILLTAGQSINQTPSFPRKNCDAQHYITIRTSTPDSQLPAEGTQISPCYFGVASLPGRPAFPHCPPGGAQNLGFKIIPALNQTPVFGDHIRFIGIEFAKPPGGLWTGLNMQHSDHIIFDRVWIHGNPQEDARPGVRLDDTSYIAIINSYLNEFHCNSWPLVTCSDAHPIGGGNNTQAGVYHGTFKIYGNFLEGSGQSILFGGGPSVDTSMDIDIEGNFLFKPLTWDPSDPSYDGGVKGVPYTVKNHIELKNAARVLFRGNRLMNVWAGFSQAGPSIAIFAVSQSGKCPTTCQVHDLTVAYNYISNAERAMNIYNGGSGHGNFALEGRNYSIHDLIADGLDYPTAYQPNAAGYKVELGNGPSAPASDVLMNVTINHITLVEEAASVDGFLTMSGSVPTAQSGIVWKNSVVPGGKFGVSSTGDQGSCAAPPAVTPIEKFNACWLAPYVFTHNLILNGNTVEYPDWPAGNITFATSQAATYLNFNGGVFGDYHIAPGSPAKNAADDGTDIGANISTVLQEIAGIR